MRVEYSIKAVKHLQSLEKNVSKRIVRKIENFAAGGNLLATAKQLVSQTKLYRYRIGDYRAVFEIDDSDHIQILYILAIKHRKDVYKIENLY